VKKHSHFFEQQIALIQFIAAFDDAFVFRYTKDRVAKEKVNVRYILGPKQRVLYDIVNQAKNITLPAVAIEQTNIKRDPSRIQNKEEYIYRKHLNSNNISKIPQPIPVIMDLNVSMIAGYKEDIDQIVQNFIPWCNPYFIISWKVPEEFGLDFDDEIRSEVSWSGDVSYENPIDISEDAKYRIVGNTSFSIKGWIFPAFETTTAPIYVVNSNFHTISTDLDIDSAYDSYPSLSGIDYSTTDVILISAYPEFTNEFVNGRPFYENISIPASNENVITFYGKRFDFNNKWYLNSNIAIPGLVYEQVTTAKFPIISAYRLPDEVIQIVNDNIAVVSLSAEWLNDDGFTIVTANSAGWSENNHNILVYTNDTYVYTENGDNVLTEFGDSLIIDSFSG
jgi:hypothetical protein